MTDREAFLARWSRRKREAAAPPAEPVRGESAAPTPAEGETSEPAREPAPAPQPAPELPPIDTIDAATDIRAFLEAGVPQDLARAALRRAWSSDPAIRDFIGLSENSWDFTAPDGVPGFGPFAPDAARQLVAQVLGDAKPDAGAEGPVAAVAEPDPAPRGDRPSEHEEVNAQQGGATEARLAGGVSAPDGLRSGGDTAMQQQTAEPPASGNKSHS